MTVTPSLQDASVVVALDTDGRVAVLGSRNAEHGEMFLPGGRRDPGEDAELCARRELREEAGVRARTWRHLGTYAVTLGSDARVSLFLAESLTLGPQELNDTEADFKLSWWPLADAITAATEGRFLLPAGPLALLLADRLTRG
ncbi:NUDIX hydrolase [Streptomyces sp. NPDC057245]|uniref:NUDIX hydrolase n=1 Tax=Streptomyces TaxID=1883 RepID=UPI001C1E1166|nr:NUDIX hydrolase [Streptomyces sp. A108]MBU6536366.1 NUDIX hydrolase [Streptomyces sp. A108]